MKFVPIIISGGSGSRLWPVSRKERPKPFMRLNDGMSLLQHAFLRAAHLPAVSEILTVTNKDLLFSTLAEYEQVNSSSIPLTMIREPFGRDTAGAVAAATLYVNDIFGGDAILLLLPADHIVHDLEAFKSAVRQANQLASSGRIVTFGITPTHPETAYGYIEAQGETVTQFVEKPTASKAAEYVQDGRFFWNAGMLCFKAKEMLRLMESHCPDILEACRACMAVSNVVSTQTYTDVPLDAEAFSRVPAVSIDYALLEKTSNIAMVPCDMGWSDVGSWNAMAALTEPDAADNRVFGDAILVESSGCYVHSEHRLVGTVGLQDVVIVDTADAVLVANNKSLQSVRKLYETLQERRHEAHDLHQVVHRPWGSYTVLEEEKNFKIKRIEVKSGASLSLQMHHHRSEHWVVVKGTAVVVNNDIEITLTEDESTYIEKGHKHRLSNPLSSPLIIIEVQIGEYLGEDDIVRFDDIYGRS